VARAREKERRCDSAAVAYAIKRERAKHKRYNSEGAQKHCSAAGCLNAYIPARRHEPGTDGGFSGKNAAGAAATG